MPNLKPMQRIERAPGPATGNPRSSPRIAGWRSLLLLGLLASGVVQAEVTKEYQVKAAFLYNFTKFVEWPSQHFTDDQRPIVIGVLGRNPFGDELQKIIKGRNVNGRTITIRLIETPAEARSADIVFICAGEEKQLEGMWQELHDAGVLTVGESKTFADHGGMITFLVEGDKIRFAIDLTSSDRARLKISAQLLKLAISVHRNS